MVFKEGSLLRHASSNFLGHAYPGAVFLIYGIARLVLLAYRQDIAIGTEVRLDLLRWEGGLVCVATTMGIAYEAAMGHLNGFGLTFNVMHELMFLSFFLVGCTAVLEGCCRPMVGRRKYTENRSSCYGLGNHAPKP